MIQDYFPTITVAIVTYNSQRFVKFAIDSVLASSYTNFELIIIDDLSTDNTWNIIQQYKDSRIRAYRNEVNLGEYSNRNQCIELAKGEYFIFIDGDDYIYPHGLEQFINGAKLDPSAGMIISREESDHMIYPVCIQPQIAYKYDFLGESLTSQGFTTTLFKTEILKKEKLSEEYISGDGYIKKKLAFEHTTVLISSGLAWWRKTPGQASEILFNSYRGLVEHINIKQLFLRTHAHYLTKEEYKSAKRRLFKPVFRKLLKMAITLNYRDVVAILKTADLEWSYADSIFYKKKEPFRVTNSLCPLNSLKKE